MFVELREQFTAKQFVDVTDIESGSYQEALMKKRVLLTGIILFLVVAAGIVMVRFRKPQHTSQTNNSDTYEYYYNNEDEEEEDSLLPENLDSILADNKTVPLDTIPSSTTVLVNRKYLLPSTYIPKNLVVPNVDFSFSYVNDKRKMRKIAATALEKLFAAGEKKGIKLYGVSGYRSYTRQKEIYDRNVATRGKAATDAVSAMPGSSEHQTGLTIDVSAQSVSYRLDQSFGDTKEGKWLAKHCHEYGFIIRYPYDKEKITGYSYEPWHIRYVGTTVAAYLYKNNLTLEEYYGVTLKDMEDSSKPETSVDVEDPDSVVYATPKPTKKPKDKKKDKKDKKAKSSAKPKSTKAPKDVPAASFTPVPTTPNPPIVSSAPAATDPPTPAPTEPPAATNPPAEESSAPVNPSNE